jgi:4-amino-4-deoxy-L-arabinose transferase-like glycosyltransferase
MILLFLATRLLNLTKLPIFTDEAIYIRWSQIGASDASWRFISLTDGKQPMFTWVMMILLRLIHGDPLYVGRLVSVLSGFASLIGIMLVTQTLFNKLRKTIIVGFLYIIIPFTLMYDRLAVYDSMVAAFSIWNLYLAILLSKYIRLDLALILGLTLGAGMLNKTSGFISLYLIPGTLIIFDWKAPDVSKRLLKWFGYVILAAILSQIVYSVLRLSPYFHIIAEKNTLFVYSFSDWLKHPLTYLFGNIRGLFDWLINYITIPIFLLSIIPIISLKKNIAEKLLLYGYWFAPFLGLALLGRVLYPRFVLFMILPLLILATIPLEYLIEKYGNKLLGLTVLILLIAPSVWISYFIIINPSYARIPDADRGQLIDDWPAGGGVREINTYLAKIAEKEKIAVFTDGTFGLLPAAVEMYLIDNPNVYIKGIWPVPDELPVEISQMALTRKTYFIANQISKIPDGWPVKQIVSYTKGIGVRVITLFEIIPATSNSGVNRPKNL